MKFRAKFISTIGKDLGTLSEPFDIGEAKVPPKVIMVQNADLTFGCFSRREHVGGDVYAFHEVPFMVLQRNAAKPTVQ
jgi:hypothetical protein